MTRDVETTCVKTGGAEDKAVARGLSKKAFEHLTVWFEGEGRVVRFS